jgi:hypothetical protein
VSSISKARVRRSSSWDLVRRDGVQGMGDSTFSCQAKNLGVNMFNHFSFRPENMEMACQVIKIETLMLKKQ